MTTTPERRREIVSIDRATGYDPLTGGIAPMGRVFTEGAEVVEFDRDGGGMDGRNAVRVEVADMWQPGDADMGLTARGSDGAILPRVDHVRYVEPLTGLGKEVLRVKEHDRDLARRRWYAMQLRTAPRLTPIHHVIGQSDMRWWGHRQPLTYADIENREAWLVMLWEPQHMEALIRTYQGIYEIGWGNPPDTAILAPIAKPLKRAVEAKSGDVPMLRLKLERARADLRVISEIGVAVAAAVKLATDSPSYAKHMERAAKAHEGLKANAETYNTKAAELNRFS